MNSALLTGLIPLQGLRVSGAHDPENDPDYFKNKLQDLGAGLYVTRKGSINGLTYDWAACWQASKEHSPFFV